MSEVRYYADEHVARAVVTGLRRRGVDVLSVEEAGTRGAPDDEHLALAMSQQRTIFTQDADFLRLANDGRPHAGIVYASQGTSVGSIVRVLVLIHHVLSAEDMAGKIEFV